MLTDLALGIYYESCERDLAWARVTEPHRTLFHLDYRICEGWSPHDALDMSRSEIDTFFINPERVEITTLKYSTSRERQENNDECTECR